MSGIMPVQGETRITASGIENPFMATTLAVSWRWFVSPMRGGACMESSEGQHSGECGPRRRAVHEVDPLERQRRRLSFDMHDSVAQTLCSALLQLDVMESALGTDRLSAEVDTLRSILRDAMNEVRELIEEMHPSALEAATLESKLKSYVCALHARTGMRVQLQVDLHGEELTPSAQVAVFRIVQEALANAWKHAQVGEASVLVWTESGEIHCRITDDGIGFDAAHVLPEGRHEGIGLDSIRERAEMLDGHAEIESAPGRGTSVNVVIPIWR